jgi:hypothetical protein
MGTMGKGFILWLLGVPASLLVLLMVSGHSQVTRSMQRRSACGRTGCLCLRSQCETLFMPTAEQRESNPSCLVRPNGSGPGLSLEPAVVHIQQIQRQSGAEGRAVVFLVDEIVPGFEREGRIAHRD